MDGKIQVFDDMLAGQILLEKRLLTAEIVYRFPDYQDLLQLYIWQDMDVAPEFPALNQFIDYWQGNLEGGIHSVTVCHKNLIAPATFTVADNELRLTSFD